MYSILHNLLSDRHGETVFTCFGLWHFCYIAVIIFAIASVFFCVRGKGNTVWEKILDALINLAFGIYIADFFLMPFAYEHIDIEKLPFHICTAMCVACFFSRRHHRLKNYRTHFALLGFLSNLVYLIYPAGVMWYGVHPLSYRVIQTLLFHGCMTAYGILALVFDAHGLRWKNCHKDLLVLAGMTLWAILGNTLYTGQAGNYNGYYNWFFVLRDPFYLLPENIAPFVMPFVNILVFFAAEMLVYGAFSLIKKCSLKNTSKICKYK